VRESHFVTPEQNIISSQILIWAIPTQFLMYFSIVMLVWSIFTLLSQFEFGLRERIPVRYTRTKHYFMTNLIWAIPTQFLMYFSIVMLVWSILILLGKLEFGLSERIPVRYTRTKHYFMTNFDLGHTNSVYDVLFNCVVGLEHTHLIGSIRI
jgi:UDP-galactopyranose mutase